MADTRTVTATRVESERVLLRKAHDGDADGVLEIQTSDEVRRYLGGARPVGQVRDAIANGGIARLTADAGSYVVAASDTDAMLGTVVLNRRAAEAPGHVVDGGGELELSYVFRTHAWGRGYAREAATAILGAAAQELPDQPVLIVTQTANRASLHLATRLGFGVEGTFEMFDAEQTLAAAPLASFAPVKGARR